MPLYMPQLYEEETSRSMTASFYGLNKNLRIRDGEWFDMENLTSDHLPVLSVRERRATLNVGAVEPIALTSGAKETGIGERPIWIEADGRLCIGTADNAIDLKPYGFSRYNHPRQLVFMGAYLIIAPEMICVNTANPTGEGAVRRMDEPWTLTAKEGAYVTVCVCDYEGVRPNYVMMEDPILEEKTLKNGDLWHRTGNDPKLFRYDADQAEWYEVESYIELACTQVSEEIFMEIPGDIKAGDVVNISLKNVEASDDLNQDDLDKISGRKYVSGVGGIKGNSIWFPGIIKSANLRIHTSGETSFSVAHAIPKISDLTVADNRLWGAYYGEDESAEGKASIVNEIYASRRGDFFRWFLGPADDSDSPVTFSVGSQGNFTGAASLAGEPILFKENVMYRVVGAGAANYQLVDIPCEGVQSGGDSSIELVNNNLYYKGRNHVMRYDGSIPVPVSDALGDLRGYTCYTAAAVGDKYYALLADGKASALYVFDTSNGIWTKEDAGGISILATAGDTAFWISYDKLGSIRPHPGIGNAEGWTTDKSPVKWYAESGIIGLETPDEKYLTKIAIRLKMAAGSKIRVLVQYDSMGGFEMIKAWETAFMKKVTVPFRLRKCDHLRFRLEGSGDCQVFSITKTFEKAGER